MRTAILLLLFTLTGIGVQAQKEISFFEGTWDEALAESKETGKPIFMDCYTVWCGPCKLMDRNTFKDKAVAEFFNENFICVKMDMEKGEGLDLSREYRITAYPTLLILDSDGGIKSRILGYQPPEKFLEFGKTATE